MNCPNLNDKNYKALAAQVGHMKAHTIWNMNKGFPIHLNSDGSESNVYKTLANRYGDERAIRMRSKMFSPEAIDINGNTMIKSDTVDLNDNVLLDNGIPYALGESVSMSPRIARAALKKTYIDTSRMTRSMLRAMSDVLPGFNIVEEDYHTVKGTPYEKMRAWVDRDGVHLNTMSITFTSPVHELTHIWLHALEMMDKNSFDRVIQLIDEHRNSNMELWDTLKYRYSHLNDEQLRYEYAATVSGFVSEDKVRDFFLRNNKVKEQNYINKVFSRVGEFVTTLFNAIKSFFKGSNISNLNLKTASLEEMFIALTQDYIEGNSVINMTGDEIDDFMFRYYNDNVEAEMENEANKKLISNTKDILPYLINNHDIYIVSEGRFDNSKFVDNFVNDIFYKFISKKGSTKKIAFVFGKKFEVDESESTERVRDRIINELIPHYTTVLNSFKDNITEVMKLARTEKKETLRDHIQEVFSNIKPSEFLSYQIEQSLKAIGADEPILRVLQYSELKNIPELSFLYNGAIEGYDPLIVIHGQTNEEIDISVIDVAQGTLGRQDNNLSSYQVNLASAFGEPNNNFSLSNSKADIRKAIIGTTIAGMNKLANDNNIRFRIRRAGLIGFSGMSVQSYMLKDVAEVVTNAKNLFRLNDIRQLLNTNSSSHSWFTELIDDEAAWDTSTILQSWRNRLRSYYEANFLELGISEAEKEQLVNDTDTWTQYDLLQKRKKEIEHRQPIGFINNDEHKILTQYLINFDHNVNINNGQVDDIDRTFYKLTNVHNIKSDILQIFSIEAEEHKAEVVNIVNGYKTKFQQLLDASVRSHGKKLHVMGNLPENTFEHLFKRGKVLIENGNKQHAKGEIKEIILFNSLYGSYNIQEAKKAGLTNEDIALADFIIDTVRERYLDLAEHNQRFNEKKLTREALQEQLFSTLKEGTIPVLPSTEGESVRKGRVGRAWSKKFQKLATMEYIGGSFISKDYQGVHSMFYSQRDTDQQLKNMGLLRDGSSDMLRGIDMNKYDDSTMNLEYLMNAFLLDNVRKIVIEDKVIPMYNSAVQWMHIAKTEYGIVSQDATMQFLKEYYDRVVNRKNQDPNTTLAAITRNLTGLYSFISLGFRPAVWIRSTYYNVQNQVIQTLSSEALIKRTEEEKGLDFPSTADMTKAYGLLFTDFQKIYALGKKYSIINSSEIDVIESAFTNKVDRTPFKMQMAHIGNYYSDVAARLAVMVGFMLHDGSYYAHTFNDVTGDAGYNEKLDKRFFDDSGKYKSEDAKIQHQNVIERQRRTGLLDDNGKQTIGYDFQETNTRFKWYADKYIIGSMDEYQKVLLGNTYTGQLFSQFRLYSFDKFFNLIGSPRETLYGGERKVINEEGQNRVIREKLNIEGSIQSVWRLFKDVVDTVRYNGFSFEEIGRVFREADPMRLMGMRQQVLRSIMFVTIFTALKLAFDNGMSDRDRRKLKFLYGNLMLWQEYYDMKDSMIPIAGLLDNIMELIAGKQSWKRALLRYTGPVGDLVHYYELFSSQDNIFPTDKEKKDTDGMTLSEKREYYRDRKAQAVDRKIRRQEKEKREKEEE